MRAATRELFSLCDKHFGFLIKKYGCKCVSRKEESWGCEVAYANATTGIDLVYEQREFQVFVRLCRLVEGEIRRPSGEMRPDTELNCYDLLDLVSLRSPSTFLSPGAKSVKAMVLDAARNLKVHAAEILEGDFSAFPDLDRVVKARAREAAFKKWGAQAHEYGWL